MAKKKAAFIGLTGIDYVYYLKEFPNENNKCKTNEYAKYVGGPAANAAITYAALGGDATLITAYGNSPESNMIADALKSYGVKVINVSEDEALPGISTICISPDGRRTIISGQKQYKQLNFENILLDEFDFALFDCNQQDVALPLLDKIKCDIVLDAGSYKTNVDEFLKKAKIVVSSEQFVDNQGNNIFEIPYSNIAMRAMTRGEKPIRYQEGCNEGEFSVYAVDCVDSLAAGDIFHGAFCFAFYEKELSFEESLQFAAEIASESVKCKGPRAWMKKIRENT